MQVPKKVGFAALAVSSGGAIHFGFQFVVTDPSEDAFLDFVRDSYHAHYANRLKQATLEDIWSVIVSLFFVGAIFGALSIRFVSEKFGRRRSLVLAYFISSISVFLSALSYFINSFELYTLTRLTLGFAVCLSVGVGALYLSEISPKRCRGFVGMSTGVFVQLGLLLGSLVAMPAALGSTHRWWMIYLIECAVFIIAAASVRMLPDSPGYLINQGKDEAAKKSLVFFQDLSDEALKLRIDELKTESQKSEQMGLIEVLRGEGRRRVFIGIIAMFGTAFSGVAAINAFAVDIMESAGLSDSAASFANAGLSFVSLLAALGSSLVVERIGRRPLLLFANCGILLCNLFISALLIAHDHHSFPLLSASLIICIAFFLTFFALGPGPVCYFITSELNDQKSRSAAQSWTSLTQMASRSILLAGFLPLKMAVGSGVAYMILFIAPITSVIIFLYFNLPETKNRDQKEVIKAFDDLPKLCCQKSKILPI
uniref:Major facilitator superfamily (MFS) profile domain-containing protein n=1 Tax=Panagrolaimus sp. JU765 TaxID=591449 RepID=A0AC34Q4J4_9BILA